MPMPDKPSRSTFRQRLHEMVSVLKEEIVSGKRAVGEYLPSEMALAERFQLSKNSVRKGLEMLAAEGLIEKVPRVGNRVPQPQAEGVITLKFGYYKSIEDEGVLHRLIHDFCAEHPHIRVQTIPLPYDDYYETVEQYLDNEWLDVLTVNYSDFQYFPDSRRGELLEPLESNPELYGFLAKTFAAGERLLALPFMFSPVVLCYNRNHFAEKHLPEPDSGWSWDDLTESAAKLATPMANYGFYFHLLSNNRWPVFLLQNGFAFRDANGVWNDDCRTFQASIELCRNLVDRHGIFPGYLSESDADAEELFVQGKISMIMASYFSLNRLQGADFSFDVAPLPFSKEAKTLLLVIGLAVNRKSRAKEAALTLLRYLLSCEAQRTIRLHTLSLPAHKKAAEWTGEEKVEKRPSRFHMYREIVPTFRLFTELKLNTEELNVVRRELNKYWAKLADAETVFANLKELLGNREPA
jgi:multiple sugar transport system substrate-binding protein